MTDHCFSMEELAEGVNLDRSDPRRAHLDQCPRCRARLASFESFVHPDEVLKGAQAEEASRTLQQTLECEIMGSALGQAKVVRESASPLRRMVGGIFSPQLRPAWAVLSIALLVIVIRQSWQPPTDAPTTLTLRGAIPESTATIPAHLKGLGSGEMLVSWAKTPTAEQYVLVLYGADLQEIRRINCESNTEVRLMSSDVTAADSVHTARFWRILALQDGKELVRSALMAYPENR